MAAVRTDWKGLNLDLDHSEVDEAVAVSKAHGDIGATIAKFAGITALAGKLLTAIATLRSDAMEQADKGGGITLTWTWLHINNPVSWPYPLITSRAVPETQQPPVEQPPPPMPEEAKGRPAAIVPVNFPGLYVRHTNFLGEISPVTTELDVQDATWRVVPGLADPHMVSFESFNGQRQYLRHQNFEIKLHAPDGSDLFRNDATFFMVPGLWDVSTVTIRSKNFPDRALRHKNFKLWIDAANSGGPYEADASWRLQPAFWPARS
jgi:hypothetical protein